MNNPQAPLPAGEGPAAAPAPVEQIHPWADLDPEQFRLLRLAPLPTDRTSGVRPLRFAQLGRVSRHSKAQSLLRLSVQLPGQWPRKEQNRLDVWIDHQRQEVRFGPDKGLSLDPGNRGLGRFLLAQGIAWARQHCAHYQVEGGALPARDSLGEDERLRRDHCLRTLGFVVEYLDPLQLKARYGVARVADLDGSWNTEKVQLVELLDAAAMLEQADQSLREQDVKCRKLVQRIDQLKREDGSLRFSIGCLLAFCLFQAGLLIWMATR